jgi:hypothetical protein
LSRNNQSRLAAQKPAFSVEPVSEFPQTHISISVPTEFVDLPSRGIFYPPSHPLHHKNSIEIKHMTAKEEDILTSESLIKKGIVLDRLIQSLIVDRNIDPSSLLTCDRNAIFTAARATAYGNEYEATVVCPVCDKRHEIVHDLGTFSFEDPVLGEDIKISERGSCLVRLPKSNKLIEFRLVTGYDEKNLISQDKNVQVGSQVTDQLKNLVLTIDGDNDIAVINAFVVNMPAFDSRYLRKAIRQVTPNTDLKFDLLCDNCDNRSVVEVPIGVKFFWPDA